MRRTLLLGALVLAAACRKEPLVEETSPTAGLHDTGAGWFPDAYDALAIPPSPVVAAKWAAEPSRRAVYTREANCEELSTCDSDGLVYRAAIPAGELLVTFNTESVRRAEITRGNEIRAFELAYVPGLPYVLVEVERGTSGDGGPPRWRRVANDAYDAAPAYRRALASQSSVTDAAQLMESYVSVFGIRSGRFVEEAYHARIFRDADARASLLNQLCGILHHPAETRSRTSRSRIDDATVADAQRFYLRLVADETDPMPLAAVQWCFDGRDPRLQNDASRELARRFVRAVCAVTDEARAGDLAARSNYPYFQGDPRIPPVTNGNRAALRAEAAACPDGPGKRSLLASFDERDNWRAGFGGR